MPQRHAFVISGLRRKRAHLSGQIASIEKALAKLRRERDNVDAVLNLFEPATNPELIPPVRPYTRGLHFAYSELTRLCGDALREAGGPVQGQRIADYAIAAKGLDIDQGVRGRIRRKVNITLGRLEKRGLVRRVVTELEVSWELAGQDVNDLVI